jgi:thiamine biosynthesis lipoprotein
MQISFPAMGTTARVVVVVGTSSEDDQQVKTLLRWGRRRIIDLEARWSRFANTSEISVLNRARGAPVSVSRETRLLVRRAIEGWRLTGGHFDPTVHDALVSSGYDRSLREVLAKPPKHAPVAQPAPGCEGIVVDDAAGTVALSTVARFDPGAIAKGLAADLVAHELTSAGADGVCVDIGGDVRVMGCGPENRGWVIRIAHPALESEDLGRAWLADGAVASSSTLRRQWVAGGESVHHLIDPSTGHSPVGVAGVCVIARCGWLAEVLATAACVEGTGELVETAGSCGIFVPMVGSPRLLGNVAEFIA